MRPEGDVRVVRRKMPEILCVRGRDHTPAEADACCDDDGIDCRSGPGMGPELPCETSRPKVQSQPATPVHE